MKTLPTSSAEWMAYIEHNPVLLARMQSQTVTPQQIVIDVMCERINELTEMVLRLDPTTPGPMPFDEARTLHLIGAAITERDAELDARLKAIVVLELQQLGDVMISKLDDRVITTIMQKVQAKLEQAHKPGGKKR